VHERIKEGDKERVQIFEGLIIDIHRGHTAADATFTVRRVASGIGVEKIFPFYSPQLAKVEVKKVAKVRRAKLSFLRGRQGKAARLSERFTNADEFAVAVAPAAFSLSIPTPPFQSTQLKPSSLILDSDCPSPFHQKECSNCFVMQFLSEVAPPLPLLITR
jgi:large subunit ribosomal protein L19